MKYRSDLDLEISDWKSEEYKEPSKPADPFAGKGVKLGE